MSYPFYDNQNIIPQQIYQSSANSNNTPNLGTEVIRVNGISGAYQCNLPLGTRSILVTDAEQPLAYLITTDGVNRQVQAFDIALHVDKQPEVVDVEETSATNDVLKEIIDKLNSMEDKISELESNTTSFKSTDAKPKFNKSKSTKPNNNANETSN